MFTLIYIGKIKPLYIIVRNKIELFNEGCISSASIFLLIFTDWVPELESHYKAGWGMCAIICLNIIVNSYFILKLGIYNLWLLFQKLKNLYMYHQRKYFPNKNLEK